MNTKDFFKSHLPKSKTVRHSNSVDTTPFDNSWRDWQIIMALFAIAIITVVFAGLVFFKQVNSGASFMAGEASVLPSSSLSTSVFNQAALNTAVAGFQARAAVHSSDLGGGGLVADPSL